MTDYEYQTDPRLPDNVRIVHTDEQREKYSLTFGTHPETQEQGATITDFKPDHDDDSITQIEYVFVYKSGLYVHAHTTLHRHGQDGDPTKGHGECEQSKADAPEEVTAIMIDFFDAPVARRGKDDE